MGRCVVSGEWLYQMWRFDNCINEKKNRKKSGIRGISYNIYKFEVEMEIYRMSLTQTKSLKKTIV